MLRAAKPLFVALACAAIAIVSATGGCGSKGGGSGFNDPNASSGGGSSGTSGGGSGGSGSGGTSSGNSSGITFSSGSSSGSTPVCTSGATGWKCKVDSSCSTPTTLTGKVFDPAKSNPLYNVVVFIPNDVSTLPAISPGTHSCNTCDVSIGNYVAVAQTDYTGAFTLKGVPAAKQVPITVQIGKWRRTTYVDINTDCGANKVADGVLHLPGKRADGDMPQIALLTGGCDDLGCFLTGMGIDPGEFAAPPAALSRSASYNKGRVDVFQGTGLGGIGGAAALSNGTAGNCSGTACPLWASTTSFEYYDMALFSCECGENDQTKPTAGKHALFNWLNEGGKVFASHYQYTWFGNSPQAAFQGVANWLASGPANPGTFTLDMDNTFPKGVTFGKWMGVVGAQAGAGPPPTMSATVVATTVSTVNSAAPQATVRWIYDPASSDDVKYLSFGTPIGGTTVKPDAGEAGKQYCGKAVFTDLHTSGGLLSTVTDVPNGCMTNAGMLSAQQKALEVLFFDLSACVSNDMIVPPPPPLPPQ